MTINYNDNNLIVMYLQIFLKEMFGTTLIKVTPRRKSISSYYEISTNDPLKVTGIYDTQTYSALALYMAYNYPNEGFPQRWVQEAIPNTLPVKYEWRAYDYIYKGNNKEDATEDLTELINIISTNIENIDKTIQTISVPERVLSYIFNEVVTPNSSSDEIVRIKQMIYNALYEAEPEINVLSYSDKFMKDIEDIQQDFINMHTTKFKDVYRIINNDCKTFDYQLDPAINDFILRNDKQPIENNITETEVAPGVYEYYLKDNPSKIESVEKVTVGLENIITDHTKNESSLVATTEETYIDNYDKAQISDAGDNLRTVQEIYTTDLVDVSQYDCIEVVGYSNGTLDDNGNVIGQINLYDTPDHFVKQDSVKAKDGSTGLRTQLLCNNNLYKYSLIIYTSDLDGDIPATTTHNFKVEEEGDYEIGVFLEKTLNDSHTDFYKKYFCLDNVSLLMSFVSLEEGKTMIVNGDTGIKRFPIINTSSDKNYIQVAHLPRGEYNISLEIFVSSSGDKKLADFIDYYKGLGAPSLDFKVSISKTTKRQRIYKPGYGDLVLEYFNEKIDESSYSDTVKSVLKTTINTILTTERTISGKPSIKDSLNSLIINYNNYYLSSSSKYVNETYQDPRIQDNAFVTINDEDQTEIYKGSESGLDPKDQSIIQDELSIISLNISNSLINGLPDVFSSLKDLIKDSTLINQERKEFLLNLVSSVEDKLEERIKEDSEEDKDLTVFGYKRFVKLYPKREHIKYIKTSSMFSSTQNTNIPISLYRSAKIRLYKYTPFNKTSTWYSKQINNIDKFMYIPNSTVDGKLTGKLQIGLGNLEKLSLAGIALTYQIPNYEYNKISGELKIGDRDIYEDLSYSETVFLYSGKTAKEIKLPEQFKDFKVTGYIDPWTEKIIKNGYEEGDYLE